MDSVAVTQISSQASQLKKQSAAAAAGSGSSKANQKIQSKASSLTIPQNGIQRVRHTHLDTPPNACTYTHAQVDLDMSVRT